MNIKNEILVRIYIMLAVVSLLALTVLAQAFRISIFEKKKWLAKSEQFHFAEREVKAERGNILARDGSLLATSLPYYDIHFDPLADGITDKLFEKHLDSLAWCIGTYIDNAYTVGGHHQRLQDARDQGNRYLLIKRDASHLDLEKIRTFPIFNRGRYRGGLIVERKPKRERPFGILAHRTIGYVREGARPVGLEGRLDSLLRGDSGKRVMRLMRGMEGERIWVPADDYTQINLKSGMDIKTTIDINMQDIAEQALIRGLQNHDAKHGTVIVMEVKTGAIRAIANVEKIQNNDGSTGWWETYNYAVGSRIEPGSTFKLASAMALLEDRLVELDDSVGLFQGKYDFYGEEMKDASFHGLDGCSFRKAFEISSNVGIAKLVNDKYKDDRQAFVKRLQGFNLDLPTGIEIDGEVAPLIKDPEVDSSDWSAITLPWMSLGYELMLTPLQLLTFYNAVANDGRMMKPYLVDEILQYGEVKKKLRPTVVDKEIASPRTIRQAKQLLEGVVDNGTAKKLKTPAYRFAGKTGTAQLNYSKMDNSGMKYQASFAGYFPADDPVYSCIVVINDPKQNGFYGSTVAGPIFREVADKAYASKIEMQPAMNAEAKPKWRTYKLPDLDVGESEELAYLLEELDIPIHDHSDVSEWGILRAAGDTLSLQPRSVTDEIVPNVMGMGLRDAIYVLENRGLKVTVSGYGKVSEQSVPPGRRIKGQTVHLTLE